MTEKSIFQGSGDFDRLCYSRLSRIKKRKKKRNTFPNVGKKFWVLFIIPTKTKVSNEGIIQNITCEKWLKQTTNTKTISFTFNKENRQKLNVQGHLLTLYCKPVLSIMKPFYFIGNYLYYYLLKYLCTPKNAPRWLDNSPSKLKLWLDIIETFYT